MTFMCLHDKEEIFSFLKKNIYLHIYSIGDLDDFFWDYTMWYGLKAEDEIKAIILVYSGTQIPVLLALTDSVSYMKDLISSVVHLLPPKFYAHFSPGVEEPLKGKYRLKSCGTHYKMALKNRGIVNIIDTKHVIQLSRGDLSDIEAIYRESYPGNFFDVRMLDTNFYYGIRESSGLASIAGIHVYSREYGVAALGNITTHPDFRGKGFAKAVTAKLCTSLLETVEHIGLNVKADNRVALRCYGSLGFEIVCDYEEYIVELE